MTPADAAKLLAVANTLDPRMVPPTEADSNARAKAWAATLAPAMTLPFAIDYVTRHYAARTDSLMPAHLNEAWKAHRRAELEEAERGRMLETRGVPMPPEVRRQIEALLSKRRVDG